MGLIPTLAIASQSQMRRPARRRNLERALAILEALDFSPAAVRGDLEGARAFPLLLHSACDLIDHAGDLAAQSAALIHGNERRWRVFRQRVEELLPSER